MNGAHVEISGNFSVHAERVEAFFGFFKNHYENKRGRLNYKLEPASWVRHQMNGFKAAHF